MCANERIMSHNRLEYNNNEEKKRRRNLGTCTDIVACPSSICSPSEIQEIESGREIEVDNIVGPCVHKIRAERTAVEVDLNTIQGGEGGDRGRD